MRLSLNIPEYLITEMRKTEKDMSVATMVTRLLQQTYGERGHNDTDKKPDALGVCSDKIKTKE